MRKMLFTTGLVVSGVLAASAGAQVEKTGITHTVLLKADLQGTAGKELIVFDTRYAPSGINPKHYHASQITFYVLDGSGVWQEEGKPPVTLKTGDILMVTPGTVHTHWNASNSAPLRFLEFVIVDKGQRSSVPMR